MNYLFAGFTAVWIVLFFFLLRIHRKQEQLAQELEMLRQDMKRPASRR